VSTDVFIFYFLYHAALHTNVDTSSPIDSNKNSKKKTVTTSAGGVKMSFVILLLFSAS
jgi:hypothetical protein